MTILSQPFWLDFYLFGNGHGLAQPYFDGVYYWLVDKNTKRGRFYIFNHGLGAQLTSIEWITPNPGTRRKLKGREFVVFQVRRKGPRVLVSWAMTRMSNSIDDKNSEITQLKKDLSDSMIQG